MVFLCFSLPVARYIDDIGPFRWSLSCWLNARAQKATKSDGPAQSSPPFLRLHHGLWFASILPPGGTQNALLESSSVDMDDGQSDVRYCGFYLVSCVVSLLCSRYSWVFSAFSAREDAWHLLVLGQGTPVLFPRQLYPLPSVKRDWHLLVLGQGTPVLFPQQLYPLPSVKRDYEKKFRFPWGIWGKIYCFGKKNSYQVLSLKKSIKEKCGTPIKSQCLQYEEKVFQDFSLFKETGFLFV